MKRTLNVRFSSRALNTLATQNKRIVLVKESNEASPDGNAVVAWFTTTPFGDVKITWEEKFYIYASQTEFRNGAIIDKTCVSDNHVMDGNYIYEFGPSFATFRADKHSGRSGSIYMKNRFEDGEFTLFGLAQKISCGKNTLINPINAVECILNDTLAFTPVERIRVFLQANVNDSKVLDPSYFDAISLDFTYENELTICYDEGRNCFVKD